MGVTGWDFIPWRRVSIDEISPRVLAIDTPNHMIRRLQSFEYNKRGSVERIPTSHITMATGIVRQALRHNIIPVFIFDGPPESLKRSANPELVAKAAILYALFKQKRDIFDNRIAEQLQMSNALRWYFSVNHLKELLSALGVPTFTAASEAEMTAAVLVRDGIAGTVVSNDADAILFGATHVTKTLHLTKGEIERVTQGDMEDALGLDLESLRDLAVVCGCDFYDGVKGVGPKRGAVLLNQHGGLEALLRAQGYTVSEREPAIRAREVFDEPNYISTNGVRTTLNPPLRSKVEVVLSPIWGSERTEKYVREITRLWKEFGREQSSLERWT